MVAAGVGSGERTGYPRTKEMADNEGVVSDNEITFPASFFCLFSYLSFHMDVFAIVAIILAILLIAFFSGIEVAFATANRLSIELKKKQGTSVGHTACRASLTSHPSLSVPC